MSPGCEHCYAETFAKRTGNLVWGKTAERRFFADKHWGEPLKWDRAAAAGTPGPNTGRAKHLVFCASMADVFEDRSDLDGQRQRLWDLIEATPHLIWLLLTKRPQNIRALAPSRWLDWHDIMELGREAPVAHVGRWPENVWVGTTVEDQQRADERIPFLLDIPAPVRFLSCEPLLGSVDLTNVGDGFNCLDGGDTGVETNGPAGYTVGPAIGWVIAGGESGGGHRPLDVEHARSLRDQCSAARVPFLFKQHGGRTPTAGGDELDGVRWKQFPPEERDYALLV